MFDWDILKQEIDVTNFSISFWQYRCNSEFSVFLSNVWDEIHHSVLRYLICWIDSVSSVADLCMTNQIYSILLNAFELKEITELQKAHLKMVLEDGETRTIFKCFIEMRHVLKPRVLSFPSPGALMERNHRNTETKPPKHRNESNETTETTGTTEKNYKNLNKTIATASIAPPLLNSGRIVMNNDLPNSFLWFSRYS